LVIGMVIGHSGMGDACLSQALGPLGFPSKNEVLIDRGYGICKRTLEVNDHGIGLTKYGINTCKEGGYAFALSVGTDATIKQDIACKYQRQGFWHYCFLLSITRDKECANNQSYTG